MSADSEYEVESVHRAKVQKDGRWKTWLYDVKWKNYDLKDNTWEPPESFAGGSEHFIEHFWDRVDPGGRDWRDLGKFKVGEEFFPQGPPRGKRKANKQKPLILEAPRRSERSANNSETEVKSLVNEEGNQARKRRAADAPAGERPGGAKRQRRDESKAAPGETVSTNSHKGSRKRRAPAFSKLAPQPSGSIADSTDSGCSSAEVTSEKPRRQPGTRRKPSQRVARDPSPTAGNTAREEALADASSSLPAGPSLGKEKSDEAVHQDVPMFGDPVLLNVQESCPSAEESIPAHRARAANPKVNRFEDPLRGVAETSESVSQVKARIMRRSEVNGISAEPVAGPSSSPRRNRAREARVAQRQSDSAHSSPSRASKTDSGRPSRHVVTGSSSLLTFKNGSLTTVKGKSKPSRTIVDLDEEAEELSLGDGSFLQIVERTAHIEMAGRADESPIVPTGAELLELAGMDAEATALPDFEDDADAIGEPDSDAQSVGVPSTSARSVNPLADDTMPIVEPSVAKADPLVEDIAVHHDAAATMGTESLSKEPESAVEGAAVEHMLTEDAPAIEEEPEADAMQVDDEEQVAGNDAAEESKSADAKSTEGVSSGFFSAWKMTIFGPLGLGRERPVVPQSGEEANSAEEARSELFLNLDSDVSVPLLLKDIHSEKSDASFSKPMAPGKFYKSEHALALLDALRAADFSARLEIDPAASDAQKEHFERFCSRLRAGELFVEMAGKALLAICSSSNQPLAENLHIPADLREIGTGVLVAEVAIANYSAYATAVEHADGVRWCA